MSIYDEGILHYKLNEENTNTTKFLEYLKELINKIIEKKYKAICNCIR